MDPVNLLTTEFGLKYHTGILIERVDKYIELCGAYRSLLGLSDQLRLEQMIAYGIM